MKVAIFLQEPMVLIILSVMLPVNGLGTAWFKKIDVKLNGTTVSFDGNMYSHRADIENRLSYPDTVKKGHLSMMGFDEEMKAFDAIDMVTFIG